jgi:hypothetical protein
MTDFWNFHDSLSLVTHNWFWLLVALALGIVVGWKTCEPSAGPRP